MFDDFVEKFQIKGTSTYFYVRGLTVSEYMKIMKKLTESSRVSNSAFFIRCAIHGIVGWENLVVDEDGEKYLLEYSKENVEYAPESVLLQVGEFIYFNLTVPSEEEIEKYKGHIRFKYYISDEKNPNALKHFDCGYCVNNNLYTLRKCSLSEEERKARHSVSKYAKDKAMIANEETAKKNRDRYGNKSKGKKGAITQNIEDIKQEDQTERPKTTLFLQKYQFPECPVSWIDRPIKEWADVLYYCGKSNLNFFEGPVSNQLNKYFNLMRIVTSEANQIESETLKEEYDKKK